MDPETLVIRISFSTSSTSASVARTVAAKDLLSPSECHINICNIQLDGDEKPSVTIQTLEIDGYERSLTTV